MILWFGTQQVKHSIFKFNSIPVKLLQLIRSDPKNEMTTNSKSKTCGGSKVHSGGHNFDKKSKFWVKKWVNLFRLCNAESEEEVKANVKPRTLSYLWKLTENFEGVLQKYPKGGLTGGLSLKFGRHLRSKSPLLHNHIPFFSQKNEFSIIFPVSTLTVIVGHTPNKKNLISYTQPMRHKN